MELFYWIVICLVTFNIKHSVQAARHFRTESFPVAETVGSLHVRRGKTAFLQTSFFKIRAEFEYCKIVKAHDPFCSRVGDLTRQTFPCSFEPNSIQYVHNGSPIYKNDCLKLEVYIFTRRNTILQVLTLDVAVDAIESDLALRKLSPSFLSPGETRKIDFTQILPERVLDLSNSTHCRVQLHKGLSWPLHGELSDGKSVLTEIEASCTGFNVSYRHDGSRLPDVDFLTFTIFYKAENNSQPQTINYFLKIVVQNAMQNTPPVLLSRSPRIRVTDYSVTVVRSLHIQAVDFGSGPDQLLIRVQRTTLTPSTGYLAHIDSIKTPIRAFFQSDIDQGKIVFIAPKGVYRKRIVTIFFKAVDPYGLRSNTIHLSLLIVAQQKRHLTILHNPGIYLLEGQSRTLSPLFLTLACSSRRCERVQIAIWNGPQHGSLLLRGQKVRSFRYGDILDRAIVYRHDDTETRSDSIVLVASDKGEKTFFTISLIVEPKDDAAPAVITHRDITVAEGSVVHFNTSVLSAFDSDSPLTDISYEIVSSPSKGYVMKEIQTLNSLTMKVTDKFSQNDLVKNAIVYKASKYRVGQDMFSFRLHDAARPPNYSGLYSINIWINAIDVDPPFATHGKECHLFVNETQKSISLKDVLSYTDRGSLPKEISFNIVDGPLSTPDELSPKIVFTWPLGFMFQVSRFTQADIDYNKVHVQIRKDEIGPRKQIVTFSYVVTDSSKNTSPKGECILEILPVNDKPVEMKVVRELYVDEGSEICINSSFIAIQDEDTVLGEIHMAITRLPAHGYLKFHNTSVSRITSIPVEEFMASCLFYVHNGDESPKDGFQFSVSDNVHSTESNITIHVRPIDDLEAIFHPESTNYLELDENGTKIIDPSVISAIDSDTSDENLKIFVIQKPSHGTIEVNNEVADFMVQAQIANFSVAYVHKNQSVPYSGINDSFVLGLCPDSAIQDETLLRLCAANNTTTVTVFVRPKGVMQTEWLQGTTLVVLEGGQGEVRPNHVGCQEGLWGDVDPKWDLVQNATYGILQHSGTELGSELVVTKLVSKSLHCSAVKSHKIAYVQGHHYGLEPRNDTVILQTKAGGRKIILVMSIRIDPVNDEPPRIVGKKTLALEQGALIRIVRSHLNITDQDTPRHKLQLLLQTKPKSGAILFICQAKKMVWKKLVTKLKVPFHSCAFVYKHDGSQTQTDQFKVVATDGRYYTTARVKVFISIKHNNFKLINDQYVLVRNFASVPITSKNLYGEVEGINSKLVRYQVLKSSSYGVLFLSTDTQDSDNVVNFSQDDINRKKLFFRLKEKPEKMPLSEKIILRQISPGKEDHMLFLRIRIDFPTDYLLNVKTNTINVFQGEEIELTPYHLHTEMDNSSISPNDVRYRVVRDPAIGSLKLKSSSDMDSKRTTFFTQEDIRSGKLFFQVPEQHKTENETDGFEFSVSTGTGFALGKMVVNIFHRAQLSLLSRNMPLIAKKGRLTLITPLELRAKDNFDPNRVIYETFIRPVYGSILLDGRLIMGAFTQQHINELRVAYVSYDEESRRDEVVFRIKIEKDGKNAEQLLFKFEIILMSPTSMKLEFARHVNITAIEELGSLGLGALVSQRHLKIITCNGTASEEVMYNITRFPKRGILLNITSGKEISDSILQKDINANRIAYLNVEKSKSLADSFQFDVVFPACETLMDNELFIKWSVTSLLKEKVQSCDGTIHITLKREGFKGQIATVDVNALAKDVEQEHPKVYSQERAVFDEGVNTINHRITLKEAEWTVEEMIIKLKNAFNTVVDPIESEVVISRQALFKKCCVHCMDGGDQLRKNEENRPEEPQRHAIFKLPLVSETLSEAPTEEINLRKSPNQRQKQGDLRRRRRGKSMRLGTCPRGWQLFRRHCYRFFSSKRRTWRKAAKICRTKYSAALFFPRNQGEERWVSRMRGGNTIWLGIRRNKKGHWLWSDGKAVRLDGKKFINLNPREDGRSKSLCGVMHSDGSWNIKDCRYQRYAFVCMTAKK